MNNDKHLNLCITKIGDLLINGKITSFQQSDDQIHLNIPNYQRPYKWTTKNACQLVDDIEDAYKANKEVYRVGTLILYKNDKTEDGKTEDQKKYDIVDGQQRTITFLLLLKNCLSIIDDKTAAENFTKKLDELKLSTNHDTLMNIFKNHRALERRINRYTNNKDEFRNFFDYICEHCELVVVITDDLSEAFQFFDSQNSRGKELYPHDLLKAYHLREMNHLDAGEIEKTVKVWEDLDQKFLSVIFDDYLYRLKEWLNDSKATKLGEQTLYLFKGITSNKNYPYAQFYKGAYSYADKINFSTIPFVTGIQNLCKFQLNTPIVAGKPFFEYTKHYFDILLDIQDNSKYEGYFINDNKIIETLENPKYKTGVGNKLTRLMLYVAILLYVDRFCPEIPDKEDTFLLDRFVELAFIWAYSMRAQYHNVGLLVAQNYILGISDKRINIINSFNIYKEIAASETPNILLAKLLGKLRVLSKDDLAKNALPKKDEKIKSYLVHFKELHFIDDYEDESNVSNGK